jgi:pyruvate ferredoxin oxidoreductase alpha subunit
MATKVGMEVSVAIGEVVAMTNTDVIAAYPITPQTHIVEHLADLVANGELDAEFIPVESEHSTAGQGLELMHEVLYVASSMRLPIVMTVANRALSSPLSVWGDHSDAMSVRDTGWIQIFTENGQEVIDNVLCAFHIAEDHRVLLPVMVHLDGFNLTHVIEPLTFPEQGEVDEFLPPNNYPLPLDPRKPVAMGDFGPPVIYTEAKWAQEVNLRKSKEVVLEVWQKFGERFGRHYSPVESYHGDARVLLFTMGSFSETAMTAIDKMRDEGRDVGLVRLRLWRPFPFREFREAVRGAEVLVTVDRALSFGGPAPVASEIKAVLYNETNKPKVVSFVGGLGGRDIHVSDFEAIVNRGIEIADKGSDNEFEIYGVRE